MAISTIGTNSLSDPIAVNGYTPTASNMQPHNLIINGDMTVAQRGTSFANVASNIYHLDRWVQEHDASTFDLDIEQASGPAEEGFPYSLKATVQTTATTSTSGYIIPFEQRLEKSHTDQFCWGTANAKPLTLSFWIKSNRTGTYTVDFSISNNIGNNNNDIKQYTINTVNTWEYKTLTFPANTTTYSGQASMDSGLSLFWWMIAGSDYTSGTIPSGWQPQVSANRAVGCSNSTTIGDYWQITGVQLEAGSTASPFAHENVGDTLRKCQRYYTRRGSDDGVSTHLMVGSAESATNYVVSRSLLTMMRAVPTLTLGAGVKGYTATAGAVNVISYSTRCTRDIACISSTVSGTATAGQAAVLYDSNANGYIELDAEL